MVMLKGRWRDSTSETLLRLPIKWDQVFLFQPHLLHAELDSLNRVRQVNRVRFLFIKLNQGNQQLQLIALRGCPDRYPSTRRYGTRLLHNRLRFLLS
jgi:hypothetical protein